MNRVSTFVRSVLPRDPTQLLLLLGICCLCIAPHLRWGPSGLFNVVLELLVLFGLYVIHFAGTAGFLIAFRPGSHPVRRMLWWVCLPTLIGECSLFFSCFIYLARQSSGSISLGNIGALRVLSELGPGFRYAAAGLLLVAAFTTYLAMDLASLPLALSNPIVSTSDDVVLWNSVERFLWVLLTLLPLILLFWFPPVMRFVLGYFIFSHLPALKGIDIVSISANATTDAIIVFIAIRMIGEKAWNALRRSLRWPPGECVALAVVFPVGIAAITSVGQFLFELFRRTSHHYDKLPLSPFGAYFTLPSISLFLWFFPAFTEEIIFRSLLQPLFVRRYSPIRGIFLVGIIFAAAHFSTDFSADYTAGLVGTKLCFRLILSVGFSFALGWLTLRSGSVFPAAISHGLFNILISSSPANTFSGISFVTGLLWMALSYALFSYWPIQLKKPDNAEI